MPTFLTACPRNCYSTCSMRVTVEDGRVVRIDPRAGEPRHARGSVPQGAGVRRAGALDRPDRRAAASPRGRLVRDDRRGTTRSTRIARGAARGARASSAPQSRPLLHRQRHQGPAQRRRPRLLAPVRRLHDDLRRPLLAGRARGDPPDARRQLAQRAVGPGERAADRRLGQESGGDQRPPDRPPRPRARAGRATGGRRPAPHRDRRARRPAGRSRGPAPTAPSPSALGHLLSCATGWSTGRSSTRTSTGSTAYAELVAAWTPPRAADGHRRPGRDRSRRCARAARRSSPGDDRARLRHAALHQLAARRCARCSRCSRSPGRSAGRARAGCTPTCRPRSSPR